MRWITITEIDPAMPARNTSVFVVAWLWGLRPVIHILILKWMMTRSIIIQIVFIIITLEAKEHANVHDVVSISVEYELLDIPLCSAQGILFHGSGRYFS